MQASILILLRYKLKVRRDDGSAFWQHDNTESMMETEVVCNIIGAMQDI